MTSRSSDRFMAFALCGERDPRALPALIRLLKDPDREVREAAARALGEFGDPSAIAPLIEALAVSAHEGPLPPESPAGASPAWRTVQGHVRLRERILMALEALGHSSQSLRDRTNTFPIPVLINWWCEASGESEAVAIERVLAANFSRAGAQASDELAEIIERLSEARSPRTVSALSAVGAHVVLTPKLERVLAEVATMPGPEPGTRPVDGRGLREAREAHEAQAYVVRAARRVLANILHRIVNSDATNLDAHWALVEYNLAQVDGEQALKGAAEIRKIDSLAGHDAFARCYSLRKRNDLARAELIAAVSEQPDSAKAHCLYGSFLLRDRHYAEAAQELETALRLDPSHLGSCLALGELALLSDSNYARGAEALEQYLALTASGESNVDCERPIYRPFRRSSRQSQHADAWFWLGQLREKQGRPAEAKKSYERALELRPQAEEALAALTRVSQTGS